MSATGPITRYNRSVILLTVAYAFTLFGVNAYFDNGPPHGILAYLAAAIPAFPIVGIFVAIARYLRDEPDEYIRVLEVRKALIATGFTLTVATIWGFIESFDLAPHVDAYWAAVLWFGGLGLGSCVNKFEARGSGV